MSSSEKYKTLLSHLGPDEKVFAKINAAERGIFIRENKENALFLVTLAPSLPSIVRNFAAWIIDRFIGDEIFAGTLRSSRQKGVEEYWKINEEKYEFRRQFQKLVKLSVFDCSVAEWINRFGKSTSLMLLYVLYKLYLNFLMGE